MVKLQKYEVKRIDEKCCLVKGNALHLLRMDELYYVISDFNLNECIITQKILKHIISNNIKYNLNLELKKIQDSDSEIINNEVEYFYNGIHYYDTITDIIEFINLINIQELCAVLDDIEIYEITEYDGVI